MNVDVLRDHYYKPRILRYFLFSFVVSAFAIFCSIPCLLPSDFLCGGYYGRKSMSALTRSLCFNVSHTPVLPA